MSKDEFKLASAREAIKNIIGKKIIGVGTGSTVNFLIEEIGKSRSEFLGSTFIPTSDGTKDKLLKIGLNVVEEFPGRAEISIDGCDEIDQIGNMIKGGGGALTREKMVAYSSKEMLIIADSGKSVLKLGKFGVPVEILPFLYKKTMERIEESYVVELRNDRNFRTDNGNMMVMVHTGLMDNPGQILEKLKMIPGVVEVGIFTGMATESIICGETGCVRKKYK